MFVQLTRPLRRNATVALTLLAAGVIAGCSSTPSSNTKVQPTVSNHVVTMAVPFPQTWIFPIWNVGEGVANLDVLQSWLPLYWFGDSGRAEVNYGLSLANPPVYSNDGKTVTIRLKTGFTWSNGTPVTTRDVQFWMNLLVESDHKYPANWVGYSPTGFPFNIDSIKYPSATSFSITFNKAYNHGWLLYNELAQIFPIPQYAWDRTAANGRVGNYDLTPAGALKVLNFLNSSSAKLASWGADPLWQAVDGPYKLVSYSASTGVEEFTRNAKYTGPGKPTVSKYELVPYTSDTAELAALLDGSVDYGYVPLTSLSEVSVLKHEGYQVAAWPLFGIGELYDNLTNPTVGPIFKQLYVRQAMQHLINQTQFVKDIFKGYATPTYGPVPTAVPNSFADSYERSNPYPYSVAAASSLLSSHGWRVAPGGLTTCGHAGTGASECGAGIAAGAPLRFTLDYAAGQTQLAQEAEGMLTDFSKAGIQLTLKAAPSDQLYGELSPCSSSGGASCSWQLIDTGGGWVYSSPDFYPSGEEIFATGAGSNSNGYSSRTADALIAAAETSPGASSLYAYENFMAKELPTLWLPWEVNQVSAISPSLKGVLPQDPYGQIYPQYWRWVG